jgi:hypothetical protein
MAKRKTGGRQRKRGRDRRDKEKEKAMLKVKMENITVNEKLLTMQPESMEVLMQQESLPTCSSSCASSAVNADSSSGPISTVFTKSSRPSRSSSTSNSRSSPYAAGFNAKLRNVNTVKVVETTQKQSVGSAGGKQSMGASVQSSNYKDSLYCMKHSDESCIANRYKHVYPAGSAIANAQFLAAQHMLKIKDPTRANSYFQIRPRSYVVNQVWVN